MTTPQADILALYPAPPAGAVAEPIVREQATRGSLADALRRAFARGPGDFAATMRAVAETYEFGGSPGMHFATTLYAAIAGVLGTAKDPAADQTLRIALAGYGHDDPPDLSNEPTAGPFSFPFLHRLAIAHNPLTKLAGGACPPSAAITPIILSVPNDMIAALAADFLITSAVAERERRGAPTSRGEALEKIADMIRSILRNAGEEGERIWRLFEPVHPIFCVPLREPGGDGADAVAEKLAQAIADALGAEVQMVTLRGGPARPPGTGAARPSPN